jgi:chromosome segregation ATPase
LDEPASTPAQLTRPATPSALVSGLQSADLTSLQAQLDDAREQLAGERLARRLAEQDMEAAEQKAAELAQDKAKLTGEALALQEQLASLTADAANLQVALDDANAALVDWQTAVDQWQAQCVAHEATIAALQAQNGQ